MNKMRKIAATFTSAAAIAALFTVSASAETRHRDETTTTTTTTRLRDGNMRRDGQTQTQQHQQYDRGTRNYDRSNGDRNYGQRSTEQRSYDRNSNNNSNRSYDRNYNNNSNRNYDRNYGRSETRNYDRNRSYDHNYDRNRSYDRNYGYRNDSHRYDSRGRAWYPSEGRVSRFVHENGGYRVWISGGRYPVWIPEARWRLFPLRVGLSIRIGGWLDPLGYIDAYEYGPLGGPVYGSPIYSSGELRGVVENVDYGRGTVVLRDDNSGNFVTAFMRDRGLGDIRPGDYVALSGGWTRSGVFEAYRLDDIQGGRY